LGVGEEPGAVAFLQVDVALPLGGVLERAQRVDHFEAFEGGERDRNPGMSRVRRPPVIEAGVLIAMLALRYH
jgi:hypothetical protein